MMTNKKILLSVAIGMAVTFLWFTPEAWSTLGQVYERQSAANERLKLWKAQYSALLPVNDRWDKSFVSENQATDLLKLFRFADLERHGLSANVDTVRQTDSIPVRVNNMEVGLQKLCLSSSGSDLVVSAKDMTSLRIGLKSLSKRRDLSLGSVTLAYNSTTSTAEARIRPFCVLIRTTEDKPKNAAASLEL